MPGLELIPIMYIVVFILFGFLAKSYCLHNKENDPVTDIFLNASEGRYAIGLISLLTIVIGVYIYYNARTEEETKIGSIRKGWWIPMWSAIIGAGWFMFLVAPYISYIQLSPSP